MDPLIRFRKSIALSLLVFLLAYVALPKGAQAVSPAPDGGYPNGNTAEGDNALLSLSSGFYNTAVGLDSLLSLTDGNYCTSVGAGTLLSNTADGNTAIGAGALFDNTTGNQNTANGAFALFSNVTGSGNTAIGRRALQNDTGSGNTALGRDALQAATSGDLNIAVGLGAGSLQTTGSSNIFIGDVGGAGVSNVIAIGNSPVSGTSYDKFYAGAVYGVTTDSTTTLPVIIDNFGQLGTSPSAARFKKEIKPMDKTSEAILALKPVTFHYKSDNTNRPEFGLIAEDVAAINPSLVVRDKNGAIYGVRYDQVNAMLLNEFLKEHRKVEQLAKDFESKLAAQQRQIEALTAGLQKVSAHLEASKPMQQAVASDQ